MSYSCPCTVARQISLSFTISWSLLKLMSIELVMPSTHLILYHPFLLPSMFPASGSLAMSPLFTLVGQSFGTSALALVLPMNIQGWFPLGLTGLISLQSKRISSVFSSTSLKASVLRYSVFFFIVQLSHPYMSTGKAVTLIIHTFVGKVMSLLFNMLSRFVIAFLLRNKHLLISWLQSPYAFIWNPRK